MRIGRRWPLSVEGGLTKYDGSGGVRAAYSSTRERYVRWTARIFVGSTGARYDAAASSRCVPSSSTIASPSRRPQRGSPSTSTRTRRWSTSKVRGILLDLPGADDLRIELPDLLAEPLDLEALHCDERRDEVRTEALGQPRIGLECVE